MRKNQLIFFLFAFLSTSLFGQRLDFRNFSTDDGLSSNSILCLHQDEDNTLWIGTSSGGINHYNGFQFFTDTVREKYKARTVYHIDKYDSTYFFSTNSGLKLHKKDSTWEFNEQNGLKGERVYKTFRDSKGIIWVATQKGIQQFNRSLINTKLNSPVDSIAIFNIYEDSRGRIWFCTLFNGLYRYDRKKVTHFKLSEEETYGFVCDVLEIEDDKYFVSSRGGLFEMEDDQMTKVDVMGISGAQYYGLFKDSHGSIWIGSDEGAFVYRDGKFERFTTKNGLVSDYIWNIYEDNENTMWFISHRQGISQLNSERFSLYDDVFFNNKVISIFPKNDSIIFVGADSVLCEFNTQNSKVKTIFGKRFEDKPYSGIYDSETDEILVGLHAGIARLKGGKVIEMYDSEQWERSLRKVWKVFKSKKGETWLGTGAGVAKIVNNEIRRWDHPANNRDHVFDIKETQDGKLYFASEQGLFALINGKFSNISSSIGLPEKRIRQLAFDNKHDLWIASTSGLYKLDHNKAIPINYKNVKDDVIVSIAFDKNNNLWGGLATGAIQISFAEDTTYEFYSQQEGFAGRDCNNKAIWIGPSGDVYFGTNAGLTVYHPKKDFKHKIKPNLRIELKVQGLNDLSEYCDGFDENGLPINLVLPPSFTEVTFENRVTSLRSGGRIQLEYRLESTAEWKVASDNAPAVYSKLPPGKFHYEVRVKDHQQFAKTPPISLSFEILKPFYLRWWFILICIGIGFTWIYSYTVIKKTVNQLNVQKEIITKQKDVVEEKNREIVDSITYAKRIQDAILPKDKKMSALFPDYFVVYTPRDIVSGDFYWVEHVGDWIVFAAADCTGHGVPGAMVSLMCSNLLRKVIVEEKTDDPGLALDLVAALLLDRLRDNEEQVTDGMDITLCYWNQKEGIVRFAGANNPLFLIRDGELTSTKVDKQPIGYFEDRVPFNTHTIEVQDGDQLVMFSDGLKDQFGGPKNKKFSTKRFKNVLLKNSDQPLENQGEILHTEFLSWKGDEEQVDDICVFSVKLNRNPLGNET